MAQSLQHGRLGWRADGNWPGNPLNVVRGVMAMLAPCHKKARNSDMNRPAIAFSYTKTSSIKLTSGAADIIYK